MKIHHIDYEFINGYWTAKIFSNENTCISWQRRRSIKIVRKDIVNQLIPKGIPYTVQGLKITPTEGDAGCWTVDPS